MSKKTRPRLLNEVMEAIASLREGKGSTINRIVHQVENLLTMKKKYLKHDSKQIVKALKRGVDAGLIKRKSGKFKLGLDPEDYKVFRNFTRMDIYSARNGRAKSKSKRRARRRSRRSRRKRSLARTDRSGERKSENGSTSRSISTRGTPLPADKSRRRRRKSKSRRRGKKGRKYSADERWSRSRSHTPPSARPSNLNNNDASRKQSSASVKSANRRIEEIIERHEKASNKFEGANETCGNSECLYEMKRADNHNNYQMHESHCSMDHPDLIPHCVVNHEYFCNANQETCGNPECLCGLNPVMEEQAIAGTSQSESRGSKRPRM